MYEKHIWSLLLHKTFKNSYTLEKMLQKVLFSLSIMAQKGTLPANVLKTRLPGQRLMSSWHQEIKFATVHVTGDDVSFCDRPGMLILKAAKPCFNSTWIALLIHGLTRLLIACGIAFYAIITLQTSEDQVFICIHLVKHILNNQRNFPSLCFKLSDSWHGNWSNSFS